MRFCSASVNGFTIAGVFGPAAVLSSADDLGRLVGIHRHDAFGIGGAVALVVHVHVAAGEGDTGEEASALGGVGVDRRSLLEVGVGADGAADRAGGDGGLATDLEVGLGDELGRVIVGEDEGDVGGRAADLEADRAGLERDVGREAPAVTDAAGGEAVPDLTTDHDGRRLHARDDRHADRAPQELVRRRILGIGDEVGEDVRGGLGAVLELVVLLVVFLVVLGGGGRGDRRCKGQGDEGDVTEAHVWILVRGEPTGYRWNLPRQSATATVPRGVAKTTRRPPRPPPAGRRATCDRRNRPEPGSRAGGHS